MKIGINGRTFSISEPGGAVQTGVNITKKLASNKGDDVTLFGHHSLRSLFKEGRIVDSFFIANSQAYGLLWEQVVPPIMSKYLDIDVLYCPNGNNPIYEIDVPTVVLFHDILNYLGHTTRSYKKLQELRLPRAVEATDHIITVSEFSKSEITNHLGVTESKISVVYNGISDTFRTKDSGERFPLPEKYLLYVGGMHGRKNIEGIIESFLELRHRDSIDHDLVLIGPKKKKNYSSVDVDWSHIRSRNDIHIPGFVSERQLKFAYSNADVFLFPSHYEGFGIPPLEAMACGTPVVASNTSAFPEVLGDAAVLVDPDDSSKIAEATVEIISDHSLRTNLVERGKKHARKFTWDRSARETREILRQASES